MDGIERMFDPAVFDADRAEAVIESVTNGSPIKLACRTANLSYDTVKAWCKSDLPVHRLFRERLEEAYAIFQEGLIQVVHANRLKDWRAAAWLLERRFPKQWGPGRGQKSTGPNLTQEQMDQIKADREILESMGKQRQRNPLRRIK